MSHAGPLHRRGPAWSKLVLLCLLALGAVLLHVALGSSDPDNPFRIHKSIGEVIREILAGPNDPGSAIVWRIRLPRALACALVGAILGMVGSAFQALFRNPLAEPYIVGVSSGAAVGGATALMLGFGGWFGGLGLMACAFAGGAGSLALVLSLAGRRGRTDVQILLLSGVVIGAMLSAVLTLLLYSAGMDANQILHWMLGMATPMFWNKVAILAVAVVLGAAVLAPQGRKLNALAMNEETAQRLGIDAGRLKATILLTGTAMAAIAVGSVGVIGFLGLVAPHIARRLLGIDWRWSLLGAGAIGAGLLALSDILAQRVIPGAEIPVGIVTAILGAPFLLVLMRREGN